nr:sigma factor [uncultured Brevundimonas sp.]
MGRDQTFEALLSEHGAMLRRIASGYEADRERRRELEQEILLAVWRAAPQHRGEAPLRAFIARVAHMAAHEATLNALADGSTKTL